MPELPEVETIARTLRPELVGRTILEADLRWRRTLAFPSARKFKQQIKGQMIKGVGRRAKYINIQLQDCNLMIHLRMSGDLLVKGSKIKPEKHDRLILTLTHSQRGESKLVFNDTRKFGRVWLTDTPEKILGKLGPEPLGDEFTAKWLHENLQGHHRQLKPLLLDQTFLAGLGNIYTDEALHKAKLHPLRASDSVNARQAEGLWNAIREVLQEGIRTNGASIDWVYRGGEYQNHFRVYDRTGEACPVCGTKIKKLVVGQRGTHICPKCQVR
ncbi:MAG: bifunctional DNA-formamidopyrimidine glycosylase/DNA-(apurinic or apyrimidinic site) lyase [Anaerolineales bacterium]|nr:bifunctional DNA-formamidopyrimidine glycosylase/DNA-(apurinic or apyrimidinic site) lyase [Anaerolineales bacterium]